MNLFKRHFHFQVAKCDCTLKQNNSAERNSIVNIHAYIHSYINGIICTNENYFIAEKEHVQKTAKTV